MRLAPSPPKRRCPTAHPADNTGVDNERASWTPRRSETEQRRMDAELLYDLEMGFTKIGRGDPALVFDEEKELFASWTAASPSRASTPAGLY